MKSLNDADGQDVEAETKKPPTKRGPRYIMPIVDNFKRNDKGRRLIKQELNKLLDKQAKQFPNRSMTDLENKFVNYSFNGVNGKISKEELLMKAPEFFDSYFVLVRKKVEYGAKIQAWLTQIDSAMQKSYKFRGLHELVWMIASADLKKTQGYEPDADDSSEAEEHAS